MIRLGTTFLVVSLLACELAAQDAPSNEAPSATAEAAVGQEPASEPAAETPEKAAIRQAIASYVESFNEGDAKKLALHWSESGEMVTPDGTRLQGRSQLEQSFTEYFKKSANAKIELLDTEVELLSPSVAVESGVARVIVPEQEPGETQYKAIHIKSADGWKIDSVTEFQPQEVAPSHFDQLEGLSWLIGHWVDADEQGRVDTTCRWSTNQNFIVRQFKVLIADRVDFAGTQIIGWDPHSENIRSWTFDSDGGFGVGRWSVSGNRWTVHSLNVLPDGRRASATNIYDLIDSQTVQFQSIGRQVDGELLPKIEPVTMVRASDQ